MNKQGLKDRHSGRAASLGLLLAGACLVTGTSASAEVLTFTFQGTVASFIDTNDVFGFGAGANLAGDAIEDVYKIDTNYATFSSGTVPVDGLAYTEYLSGFGGLSSASSTIGGHTVTINATNGDQLLAYVQQRYLGQGTPPNPYNQSILELQAIGLEPTGTAIGSEFLIRDEAVSYSLDLPLSFTATYGLTLATLDLGATAPGEASAVFFSYVQGSGAGSSNLAFGIVAAVPEPPAWAMTLVGLLGLAAALHSSRRKRGAVTAAA